MPNTGLMPKGDTAPLAILQFELLTHDAPYGSQVADILDALDEAFQHYNLFQYPHHLDARLVLVSAHVGSFLGELAAVIKGVDDLTKVSDVLAGFFQSLIDGIRYICSLPKPRSASSEPIRPESLRLIEQIAQLLAAAANENAIQLNLSIEVGGKSINVQIHHDEACDGIHGIRWLKDEQIPRQYINSDLVCIPSTTAFGEAMNLGGIEKFKAVVDSGGHFVGLYMPFHIDFPKDIAPEMMLSEVEGAVQQRPTIRDNEVTFRNIKSNINGSIYWPIVLLDSQDRPTGLIIPSSISHLDWIDTQGV
jgi:hypothetical protein